MSVIQFKIISVKRKKTFLESREFEFHEIGQLSGQNNFKNIIKEAETRIWWNWSHQMFEKWLQGRIVKMLSACRAVTPTYFPFFSIQACVFGFK